MMECVVFKIVDGYFCFDFGVNVVDYGLILSY